jgi:hypothetical protein
MHEPSNGVRVSNQDIYQTLLAVQREVHSVKQTQSEVITPTLSDHSRRLDSLELRMYAIIAGLVAALAGAKGIGLI